MCYRLQAGGSSITSLTPETLERHLGVNLRSKQRYPGEKIMGIPVRIVETLYRQTRTQGKAEYRTIAGQIEFLAMIGRAALDNPDLPIDFIRDLLVARVEGKSHSTPFVPEGDRS